MEDIKSVPKPADKKYQFKKDPVSENKIPLDPALDNTKEVLDKLENDQLVSEKERKKTIQTMLTILDYQLKCAKEDVKELDAGCKKTDLECQKLQKELQREENQIAIDNIWKRKDALEQEMRDALATADIMYEEWDPYLWDVIVENNVLIDQLEFKGFWDKNWRDTDLFESESLDSR